MSSGGNNFFDFLNKKGGIWVILLLVSLGLMLIFTFSEGGSSENEEERLAELCSSLEGVGKCRVMLSYSDGSHKEPVGVIIACKGGDRVDVCHRLVELVGALYGIGSNRIAVEKLE